MKTKIGLLILIFAMQVFNLCAQKKFSEGVLTYNILVDGKESGTYIITVKQNNIARKIDMLSGFSNISVYNAKTGTTTTINYSNGNKYALQLSAEEVKAQNEQFENATFVSNGKEKTIATYSCKNSVVTYKNGMKNEIYFTTSIVPSGDNFNMMFPGLDGIPLEYEIKASNGQNMKFVASSIEIKGVDNNAFLLPKEYKLITKAELEKLN
jgi:uncharacterized protein YlzI (FlbEa/FlbD family)